MKIQPRSFTSFMASTFLWIAMATATATAAPDLLSLAQLKEFQALRASSAKEDLTENQDNRPIEAGETLVLGELEGPGVINHIWITLRSANLFVNRALVFRVYYDGAEEPSVEVPLGDFFAMGHGARVDFESLPVSSSSAGRSLNCYWPMPFRKSARVTITNEDPEIRVDSFYYYLDWQKHESLPENLAYFHAHYRQEHPAKPGDYTILETEGRGHYVGTVLSVHQTEFGWFGEGDDRFYVDGEDYPSLSGTGTEDYFGDAWGFRVFDRPFYGVTLFDGHFPGDRVTAYRWHLADPIPFEDSFKFQIEHYGSLFTRNLQFLGQFFERYDWYSSVAFWYQTPARTFDQPIAPYAERLAPYHIIPAAEMTIQADPDAVSSGKIQVNFTPSTENGSIEFTFQVEEEGLYQINAVMSKSFLGGVYQPYLDDMALGEPIDFNIEGQEDDWLRFDLHSLEPGEHTLRFEGRGTSPNKRSLVPPMNALSMSALVLLRVQDMDGFQRATQRALEERRQVSEKKNAAEE